MMDITSDTLRFNSEGEATARGMGSDARSDHDQTLRCIDMVEGLDRSRRGFLQAVPAIAALPLAGVSTGSTDPHVQWLSDHREAMRDFVYASDRSEGGNGQSEAENAAYTRLWSTSERISTTVAQTPDGIAAQLTHFLEHFGDDCFGDIPDDLDRRLIENAIAGLEGPAA